METLVNSDSPSKGTIISLPDRVASNNMIGTKSAELATVNSVKRVKILAE